ncbi:unnamed protein product [Pleuronectes platessa]|uniref:Uncharacterized protein n=1 Tax=Pleuronectes platessa TaxID=8262 RepID=A0A9N7YCF1_PLEPL|nr:unnamed protein product [Pleuronectes platessa]
MRVNATHQEDEGQRNTSGGMRVNTTHQEDEASQLLSRRTQRNNPLHQDRLLYLQKERNLRLTEEATTTASTDPPLTPGVQGFGGGGGGGGGGGREVEWLWPSLTERNTILECGFQQGYTGPYGNEASRESRSSTSLTEARL